MCKWQPGLQPGPNADSISLVSENRQKRRAGQSPRTDISRIVPFPSRENHELVQIPTVGVLLWAGLLSNRTKKYPAKTELAGNQDKGFGLAVCALRLLSLGSRAQQKAPPVCSTEKEPWKDPGRTLLRTLEDGQTRSQRLRLDLLRKSWVGTADSLAGPSRLPEGS